MFLGIDVGGTFTDAVLVEAGAILAMAKAPTTHGEILRGILAALDQVIGNVDCKQIVRVVISSTIVTNCLMEGHTDDVFLAVMTGPGMSTRGLFPVEPYLVKGYVDHRGKVTVSENANLDEMRKVAAGKPVAAVSGKFAVRNQDNEKALYEDLSSLSFQKIFCASELSGELNFVRRTNTAYFSAAVFRQYAAFIEQIKKSMSERNIDAPVHILKADGGTLPLAMALEQPAEAVFTGPAASVLGIEAIDAPQVRAISLDVGGTTTDIAFWEDGLPLMAKKGAKIVGFNTSVRAFHMRSLGIGGDSRVTRTAKGFRVGPERAGRAMALGGAEPTLSDALIVAGLASFGDSIKAQDAIRTFCKESETPQALALAIVDAAVQTIATAINEMLYEWSIQPVYMVDDVMAGSMFVPELLIGVGGGAPGLIKALGQKMHLPVEIPQGAMVANAIGAALAKPTLSATLRADTTEGYYIIPEAGIKQKLPRGFDRVAGEGLLTQWLCEEGGKWGLETGSVVTVVCEEFPTIHNSYSTGKIIYLKMQLCPGIVYKVTGREVAF